LRARLEEDTMNLKAQLVKDKEHLRTLLEEDDKMKLREDINMKEKYLNKLKDATMKDKDIRCIEIAGLCHDIGHGPYSHLFDRLFNKAIHKKKPGTKEWEHEDVSVSMLDYMMEKNRDVKDKFIEIFKKKNVGLTMKFIQDLIKGKPSSTEEKARFYMYEIVANKRNEIDVDKMDYFARDCHGLGMKSNFDHLRFISQCRVMFLESDNPDETTIAVRDKEEYNLYELFHTRIGLFRKAYYHEVNKAIEL
ncbi:hypothetical protein AM593_04364, partial [Mytilus galloprovincialis]